MMSGIAAHVDRPASHGEKRNENTVDEDRLLGDRRPINPEGGCGRIPQVVGEAVANVDVEPRCPCMTRRRPATWRHAR